MGQIRAYPKSLREEELKWGYGVRPHGNQKVGMSERRQRAMPMVGGANLTKGWNDSEEVP